MYCPWIHIFCLSDTSRLSQSVCTPSRDLRQFHNMIQVELSSSVFEDKSFICPEFSDNFVGQSSSLSMSYPLYSFPNIILSVLQQSPLNRWYSGCFSIEYRIGNRIWRWKSHHHFYASLTRLLFWHKYYRFLSDQVWTIHCRHRRPLCTGCTNIRWVSLKWNGNRVKILSIFLSNELYVIIPEIVTDHFWSCYQYNCYF